MRRSAMRHLNAQYTYTAARGTYLFTRIAPVVWCVYAYTRLYYIKYNIIINVARQIPSRARSQFSNKPMYVSSRRREYTRPAMLSYRRVRSIVILL